MEWAEKVIASRDIDVLARTVYGEARGESDLGKLAVALGLRPGLQRRPLPPIPNEGSRHDA